MQLSRTSAKTKQNTHTPFIGAFLTLSYTRCTRTSNWYQQREAGNYYKRKTFHVFLKCTACLFLDWKLEKDTDKVIKSQQGADDFFISFHNDVDPGADTFIHQL